MIKQEDIKIGEIYLLDYINYQCIVKAANTNFDKSNGIQITKGDYYKKNNFYGRPIRLATPEECHWFLECEKLNSFISKEAALKSFKEDENNSPFKIGDLVYLEKHYKHNTETCDYSTNLPLNTQLIIETIDFGSHIFGNDKKEWSIRFKDYSYSHPAVKFKLWNNTFNNQPKFEVGKWYKNLSSGYIAKAIENSKIEGMDSFYHGDYIDNNKVFHNQRNPSSCLAWLENTCECTLEEIQQYLPEGHVDKIKVNKDSFKETLFKKDDYVVVTKNDSSCYNGKVNYCYKCIKDSTNKGYFSINADNSIPFNNEKLDGRYATKEEIAMYDEISEPYNVTNINSKPKLTSLPIRWFIRPTEESNEILEKWRGGGYACSMDRIVLTSNKYWENIDSLNMSTYTEITFEQFKKWVLKEDNSMEDLLEEAKKRYPIGTTIKCLVLNRPVIIISHNSNMKSENDNIYFKVNGNHTLVHRKGKWSEIVTESKQEYPEYVELLENWSSDDEFIGEIFEMSTLNNLSKFTHAPSKIDFRNKMSNWIKEDYFKPSTKEAYDRQELLKQGNDLHKNYFEPSKEPFYNKVQEEKENYLYVSNEDILLSNKVNDTTSIIVPLYEPDDVVLL